MATIIGNIRKFLLDRKKSRDMASASAEMSAVFRFKYSLFKELLTANSELLNILADVEEKLKGDQSFGNVYIKTQTNRALMQAFQMVKSINALSGNKFPELYEVLETLNGKIRAVVDERKERKAPSYVMDYSEISIDDADLVGGKNANLGEIKNNLHLPVPQGFAISTRAFEDFIKQGHLKDEIIKKRNLIYVDDFELLNRLSKEVETLIQSRSLPDILEKDIMNAVDRMWGQDPDLRVAMRSSAIGEDGDISFAGQYLTLLNVDRDRICDAYKSIAASLYSARAIAYRSSKGFYDEDLAMAVACIRMVDSVASGVMYTRHPYDIVNENILINAVWGLGTYAVDGVIIPDSYGVSKDKALKLISKTISTKTTKQVCLKHGGVCEAPVEEEKQNQACLTDDQIRLLASYGRDLENHYKTAQDVEWALDPDGVITILQSRPLKVQAPAQGKGLKADAVPGYHVVIEGADVACPGLGKGLAVHVRSGDDLIHFPQGGVLIARHSSPEFVVAMKRCQAIVVESGSVSGHMAAVAREFNVPTLIGGKDVMDLIPPGMELTVDAYAGRVYEKIVHELVAAVRTQEPHMKGTPAYGILKRAAEWMTPLYLISPKSARFTPAGCRTLHDIARFCHEHSYGEMFNVSDLASKHHGWSFCLDADLPMDLHLIDLGGGLKDEALSGNHKIRVEQILSVPFLALLSGMMSPEIASIEPRPVNLSGFFSVMREQVLFPGHVGERFGDRSYAIIADKYLNFSSRVGYHYSVVDAYCGKTINKNYITFSFKGGAADKTRRIRRVKAIALILEKEGFHVDMKADKVDARILKYPCTSIESRLDMLGKLLIFTRQMDMLMTSDASVEWVAENFVKGNYRLSFTGSGQGES
ncbi:MAG: phosphoenolpyruvate synthase [Proteobacteria bacterium]|nr:phosphoenolpyruvate synthase [Pseudomonadota bacterium]